MSTQTLSLSGKDAGALWISGDLGKAVTFSSISLGNHQKSICHKNKRDLRLSRSTLSLSLGSTWGPGERTGEEEVSLRRHTRIWSQLTPQAIPGQGAVCITSHTISKHSRNTVPKTVSIWNLTALHGTLSVSCIFIRLFSELETIESQKASLFWIFHHSHLMLN